MNSVIQELVFGRNRRHQREVRAARTGEAHGGEDGEDAGERERDETKRIEACPLRDASEPGQEDMRELAGVVRSETPWPLKVLLPAIAL